MVKSRKATVKANPLPNRFSIKVSDAGITSIRKLAGNSGLHSGDDEPVSRPGSLSSSRLASGRIAGATVSKRAIFQHLTRLQHGILRYRNVAESPTSVVAANNTENIRRFVYVPAGYSMQSDQSIKEILAALDLPSLPPLLIVTAATDGAVEETMDEELQNSKIQLASPTNLDHLSEDEERELLREKTQEILKSTVELCGETGAWLLPHRPRRVNGAAEILCSAAAAAKAEAHSPHAANAVILGMIGLDPQDQKEGFTDNITSHMVPVGSEVEAIADVPYDPNVLDNTPCPELTHLLLFQRRQEMRAFRERLLAHTPDVFLAFGSTTPYAKKCLFSTLVAKSPVALVTHTSPEIDHMSWMLRHADREFQKIQVGEVDPPPQGEASYVVSDVPTTYPTLPLPPLPDLEAADPELASFLNIWPATHSDERIVLADPRRVGGVQFQQLLLRAVNAAFYIEDARTTAILEATNVLESIKISSEEVKIVTERYHLSMVVATFAAVAASVMYAKIYGADPPPSWEHHDNPYQIALFLVTIGIPFLIIFLKKRYDNNSQLWSSIQKEAANLESAIASFRTRPRTYGQSTSSSQEPLDAFVSDVCGIQSRAFAKAGEGQPPTAVASGTDRQVSPDEYDVEAPPPSETSPLIEPAPPAGIPVPSRLEDLAIRGSTSKWKKGTSATIDDKHEIAEYHPGVDSDRTQYLDVETYQKTEEKKDDQSPVGEEQPSADESKEMTWTLEEYVEARIHPVRQQKAAQLEILEQRHKNMELIIKVVLGSTTLFALLSKQWIIPIVLGVSASFVSSQDFRKYQKRVEQGQAMIRQLEDLLSWWEGLDVEGKILTSNEDRLVQTAESIIAADVSFTY